MKGSKITPFLWNYMYEAKLLWQWFFINLRIFLWQCFFYDVLIRFGCFLQEPVVYDKWRASMVMVLCIYSTLSMIYHYYFYAFHWYDTQRNWNLNFWSWGVCILYNVGAHFYILLEQLVVHFYTILYNCWSTLLCIVGTLWHTLFLIIMYTSL
jgi:hypothetical protein